MGGLLANNTVRGILGAATIQNNPALDSSYTSKHNTTESLVDGLLAPGQNERML